MLRIRNLEASYGASRVLRGVDLTVEAGQVVALMGRNGMGKTTTVRAIAGLLRPRAGRIELAGRDITGQAPYRIARAGLGLVPEGRQVFPNLTVLENLVATARPPRPTGKPGTPGDAAWTLERVLDLFPTLGERLGGYGAQLSGGEQQMLAIGRALMTNPSLLVLDEATEGLAPLIRAGIWRTLGALKAGGLAILVIDKNVAALARLADRHVMIEKGRTVWAGSAAELTADPSLRERYLGV